MVRRVDFERLHTARILHARIEDSVAAAQNRLVVGQAVSETEARRELLVVGALQRFGGAAARIGENQRGNQRWSGGIGVQVEVSHLVQAVDSRKVQLVAKADIQGQAP